MLTFFSDHYVEPLYKVEITEAPIFSLKIIRKSTNQAIFDTSLPGLIFSEQFVQLPVGDIPPRTSIKSILRSDSPLKTCMESAKTSNMDSDTTSPPGRCFPDFKPPRFGRSMPGTSHLLENQSIGSTCTGCILGYIKDQVGWLDFPPGTLWLRTMVALTRSSSSTQTPRNLRRFLCQASYTEP